MGTREQLPLELSMPGFEPAAAPTPSDGTAAAPPDAGPRGAPPDATSRVAVARVLLELPLAHLDRLFDYLVPESMSQDAVPGARVSVTFAGRQTAGFVVERAESSEHGGRLAPLRRVVSPVPVLSHATLDLVRAVAARYAGTASDVLRLAVPPRHARTELAALARRDVAQAPSPPEAGTAAGADDAPSAGWSWEEPWQHYEGGRAFTRRLAAGESPRAAWLALPDGGSSHREALAAAVAATLESGRGSVLVVPESREVAEVAAALDRRGIQHVCLRSEDGPAARYGAFLRLLLGEANVVLGTRAAVFAPVRDLGLIAVWDDGDDLLAEPRAPYPHAREVARLRADLCGSAALIGGYARSTATQQLVEDGWARAVQAPRDVLRNHAPRVVAPDRADLDREGDLGRARIPHLAWDLVRAALDRGPVLVQVPRGGYIPFTACARCRAPARCERCGGPLRIGGTAQSPTCSWCGRIAQGWSCPECASGSLRAGRLGSARTAEELGRAFPNVPVVVSAATAPGGVLDLVDANSRLVIATPGAEPEAAGGYAAAVVLDAAVTSGRPELWAAEEALRRWLGASALVRSAVEHGTVLLLGGPAPRPAQALVRWDPAGFAERELAERVALGFPPAVAMASVQGASGAVGSFLRHLGGVAQIEILGPVPLPETGPGPDEEHVRAIARLARDRGSELTAALIAAAAARSARKEPGPVRVQVDPTDLW